MVDFAPPEVSAPCRRQPCHKQAGRTNSGIASALRTASETASGRASRLPNRRGQSNPIPVSRIASRNNRAHTDKHSALRRETGYESAKESKPWTRTPDEQNFRHVIRDSGPARFQSGRPSWPNTLSYETCPFWFTASLSRSEVQSNRVARAKEPLAFSGTQGSLNSKVPGTKKFVPERPAGTACRKTG